MKVSSDQASNKQRLDVLQQQEELIEDELEQEEKEEASRREKREAEEAKLGEEKEKAREMLPDASIEASSEKAASKDSVGRESTTADQKSGRKEEEKEETDAKMTGEQVRELGEALIILSTKQSVLQERAELAQLIQDSKQTQVVSGGTGVKGGERGQQGVHFADIFLCQY